MDALIQMLLKRSADKNAFVRDAASAALRTVTDKTQDKTKIVNILYASIITAGGGTGKESHNNRLLGANASQFSSFGAK